MHSKVIIASLVCVLAAGLSGGKLSAKPIERVSAEAESTVNCAPNDEQNYFYLNGDNGSCGNTIYANLEYEGTITNFRLLYKSSALQVTTNTSGYYANITVPSSSGEYSATFGYTTNGRSRQRTIYVYSNGTYYYASMLSKYDARAKFFMNYSGSSNDRYWLSGRDWTYDYYSSLDMDLLDAEKRYGDFVYSGTSDMSLSTNTQNSSSNYVTLKIYATWYEPNGNSHPLMGIRANFFNSNGSVIENSQEIHYTNEQGYYSVTLTKQQVGNLALRDVQIRMNALSEATMVEDSQMRNYAYAYTPKNYTSSYYNTKLNTLSAVNYYISVYPHRSDRAAAYEIATAELIPYQYIQTYTYGVERVRTQYPSYSTEYRDYPWYQHVIDVQKEDYANWDLLSHEYAHYAEEMLSFGHYFSFSTRLPHTVHENLVSRYGDYTGSALAYHEGLATYVGIASQLYYKQYHPSFTVPNFGDYVYTDSYRGLTVNYNNFAPGKTGSTPLVVGAVESTVTSALLKILDNKERSGDHVSIGHQAMWDAILSTGTSDDFNDLINNIVANNPSSASAIQRIMKYESKGYTHSDWTIMIYMCGSDLESDNGEASADIQEILSVANQPNGVNIIIQTGGSYYWNNPMINSNALGRFHVRNNQLIHDCDIDLASMGSADTFEDFLNWGIDEYPADKVGVIMWNHGGALDGCCYDERFRNDSLLNSEASQAFQNVFAANDISKLEFIGYDCCLMQVQDVAEFNSNYFNYMVASEESEPGGGWAYDQWLDNLYAYEDTVSILEEIADTFVDEYYSGDNDCCLSVLDLSKMTSYRIAFESLSSVISPVAHNDFSTFRNVINSTKYFGESWYIYQIYGTIDGLDFLNKLKACPSYENYGFLIDMVIQQYNQVVIYNAVGTYAGEANGLSIHVLTERNYEYSLSETNFTYWRGIFF